METIIKYVKESDRMIIITKEDWGEIIGINYFQGTEINTDAPIDHPLTDYVLKRLNESRNTERLEQIDYFIWQYVNKEQFFCNINEQIEQQISEIVQDHCESGDISPSQSIKLEEYTNKLAEIVAEIVVQNQ